MTVLSSFPLCLELNSWACEVIAASGGRWLPSPQDRDARIAHIDANIHKATIFFGGRLTDEQFARARELRWIQVPWAGVNTIMGTAGIAQSEVVVTSASGIMADSVADHVLGMMLMLARDLHTQMIAQGRREWIRYDTESPKRQLLREKVVGIVGYGAIGRAVAERARAFGMRVIATRRDASEGAPGADEIVPPDRLHEMLGRSDYVVLAVPLTEETRGMFGQSELSAMKRTGRLVNIARGAVVVESALIDALRDGTIEAAALDVFEKEPLPPESPFWEMPNVLVTPHSSGAFQGFSDASGHLFLENLQRWIRGDDLVNVVRNGY